MGTAEATLFVLPSNERLKSEQFARLDGNDRLIVEAEFIPIEGVPQTRFQLQLGVGKREHGRREYLIPILAKSLGLVHGNLCIAEHVLRPPVGSSHDGHS